MSADGRARHPLRLRSRRFKEGAATLVELRVQIMHPMENGRRRDPASGRLLAAHYIEWLTVHLDGRLLARLACGRSVARNPVFSLTLEEPPPAARVEVFWQDNLGEQGQATHVLA